MPAMAPTRGYKRKTRPASKGPTVADLFKERLGWKPSTLPFRTTANRQCGGCGVIKPGQ